MHLMLMWLLTLAVLPMHRTQYQSYCIKTSLA
jgi:hypothetical protein